MKTEEKMTKHMNKNWNSKRNAVSRYLGSVFFALCVIAIGIGYLGNQLPFLPWTHFTIFFPGWGALFLIVPAVFALLRKPTSIFWYICLFTGVLIIASKWVNYSFKSWLSIAVAVLIILIGLRMLLSPLIRKARLKKFKEKIKFSSAVESGSSDYTDYRVEFGKRHIDMTDVDFTCSTLSVDFGEMIFDLRGARINDCAVIDAECTFGKLTIRLPDYVRVEVRKESAFASITNAHVAPVNTESPVIYIHAECDFGSIEIY